MSGELRLITTTQRDIHPSGFKARTFKQGRHERDGSPLTARWPKPRALILVQGERHHGQVAYLVDEYLPVRK